MYSIKSWNIQNILKYEKKNAIDLFVLQFIWISNTLLTPWTPWTRNKNICEIILF